MLIETVPFDVKDEIKQQLKGSTETIKEEFKKEKPKKFILKTLLSGLNGLIRTVEFGAAATAIIQFVGKIQFK